MNVTFVVLLLIPICITVNSVYHLKKALKTRGMHFSDLSINEEGAQKIKADTENVKINNVLIIIVGILLAILSMIIQIIV